MARLDDLIAQIADKTLREKVENALADMKRRQRFGLVFEEHIPETTTLVGFPIQSGATVQRKDDPQGKHLHLVKSVGSDGKITIELEGGTGTERVSAEDLLVVKRFGEPIFPTLTPLSVLRRNTKEAPHHAVINGENFHTLQLLVYLYEGQVDCIYIDPPYNTGARDWKYNNRYIDKKDAWRHSKWLSFMEKRLRLAKRLLRPDGVLIVTIDVNELHHLGMLLERIFADYLRYMVNIVINPKGVSEFNFARVEEQALFCCPNLGKDVILGAEVDYMPEESDPTSEGDEPKELTLLLDVEDEEGVPAQTAQSGETDYDYHLVRRRGSSSLREDRPTMFYPIFIDEHRRRVVRVGKAIELHEPPNMAPVNGLRPIWPINKKGRHGRWQVGAETMQKLVDAGEIVLGSYNRKLDSWTINRRVPRKTLKKVKTVWRHKSHDAGTHGTVMLARLLGKENLFPFPKSVYAVRDCIATVVRNRPQALILDFFAGSGTTLHATCLLNAADGGQRRCLLVTNNEVGESTARQLHKSGHYRGDAAYEARGVFEQVTRPRVEAVVTGRRPDGHVIEGKHVGGRPFSQGFEENVEFFRLDYLDPNEVDLGTQFQAILPCLWLAAGGLGPREANPDADDMLIPPVGRYAILFKEERFRQFKKRLSDRQEITHVWIVTDSEDAFAEMRSALPGHLVTSMLYRDYLRNFRINTRQNV